MPAFPPRGEQDIFLLPERGRERLFTLGGGAASERYRSLATEPHDNLGTKPLFHLHFTSNAPPNTPPNTPQFTSNSPPIQGLSVASFVDMFFAFIKPPGLNNDALNYSAEACEILLWLLFCSTCIVRCKHIWPARSNWFKGPFEPHLSPILAPF